MASSLYLDILNLTVGQDGRTSDRFAASDIYLVIQGRIGTGDGQYAHFDWKSGALKAMSTKDNTVTVESLGVDPNVKYAPYWITLADLLKKSYYDTDKGLPIPTPFYSGRLYLSFEKPVYIHVVVSDLGLTSPAEPDEANTADPNYGTVWDKFEFTANTDNVLYSNTTCVDFVGIPFGFSVNGSDTPTQGFGLDGIADPFAHVCKDFKADHDFSKLIGPTRLFAPKVNSENFSPFGNVATYLDPYINYCWAHYYNNTTPIEIWNYVDVKVNENSSLHSPANGKGCRWIAHGVMNDGNAGGTAGTLTFTVTKLYANDQSELTSPTHRFEIPHPSSWDTLRQGGVFAPDDSLKGYIHAIDGDIKNQVSSALNRNVMHDQVKYSGDYDTDTPSKGTICWADRDAFFKDNGVPAAHLRINKYGKFLHELSLGGLCYALAYDDKYSQNVNLSANLSPASPTVMKLMVYYKKPAAAGGSMPSASVTATDLLGGKYTISVAPDPADGEQVVIGVSSKKGSTLINCNVMYPRVPGDADEFNKYFPGATTDNAIKVSPASFAGGFRFAFRFEISGDAVPGRQYLLPADAAAPKGSVYSYDYAKTESPLTTATITNA